MAVGSASLQQLEAALVQVNTALAHPQISALDRSILTGRRRELNTARWLVQRLLPGSQPPMLTPTPPLIQTPQSAIKAGELTTTSMGSITPQALPAGLFDRVAAKLQFNLENLTSTP
ncbi:MAG: hypothetical protein HC778_00430, partial [Chamaesiphon sp. CSU_1_12]|nr:hypothetical protein [Chamaesiphon sp. CSU_1_12]